MEEKHKLSLLPKRELSTLAGQLKNSAAKGKLIKNRASYKLSKSVKKEIPILEPPPLELLLNPIPPLLKSQRRIPRRNRSTIRRLGKGLRRWRRIRRNWRRLR
ncbi:hypothetical protein LINPERPRIM_LOCUS25794 [Linum perenne]